MVDRRGMGCNMPLLLVDRWLIDTCPTLLPSRVLAPSLDIISYIVPISPTIALLLFFYLYLSTIYQQAISSSCIPSLIYPASHPRTLNQTLVLYCAFRTATRVTHSNCITLYAPKVSTVNKSSNLDVHRTLVRPLRLIRRYGQVKARLGSSRVHPPRRNPHCGLHPGDAMMQSTWRKRMIIGSHTNAEWARLYLHIERGNLPAATLVHVGYTHLAYATTVRRAVRKVQS